MVSKLGLILLSQGQSVLPHLFDNFCLANNFGIQYEVSGLIEGPPRLI